MANPLINSGDAVLVVYFRTFDLCTAVKIWNFFDK